MAVTCIVQKSRLSSNVKVKGQGHPGQETTKCCVIPIDNAWSGDACAVGRTLHAAAAESIVWPPGGDGVTAVHADGGLCAVLSGAVLAGSATPVGKSVHAV